MKLACCIGLVSGTILPRTCHNAAEKEQCVDDCQGFMVDCSKECNNDASCTSDCNREFAHCSDLCPCNKNCPNGCPCSHASEYCPTSTGIHILAFNPFPENDDPLGADSRKQIKMSFSKNQYGAYAELVYDMSDKIVTPKEYDYDRSWMCSFQLQDQMYMIGGTAGSEYRQYKVDASSTAVVSMENLPFPLVYGACHEYNNDYALACAGEDNKEHCWEFNGATEKWTQVGDTGVVHFNGDLAKFKKTAIIVAGKEDNVGITEIYDPVAKRWIEKNQNKEFVGLYGFDVVGFRDSAYLFGGVKYHADYDFTSVWQLNSDASEWTQYKTNILFRRFWFRSLVQGNTIIHIGGSQYPHFPSQGVQKVEFWEYNDRTHEFNVSNSTLELKGWYKYPESFLIGENDFKN